MIVVHGRVRLQAALLDEALRLSLDHVARSRREPGCLEHGVHRDCEEPNALVFVERWSDRAALLAHFAVSESKQFVAALAKMATEKPQIRLFEAEPVDLSGGRAA